MCYRSPMGSRNLQVTFSTTFSAHKLFSKKNIHAETLVIQMLPRVVYTI